MDQIIAKQLNDKSISQIGNKSFSASDYGIEINDPSDNLINEYFNSNLTTTKSIAKKCNFLDDFEQLINDNKNFVVFDSYLNVMSSDDWKCLVKRNKNCSFSIEEKELIVASLEAGIPDELREIIWKYLAKVDNLAINHNNKLYNNLFKIKNIKVEAEIKKDIERSFYCLDKKDYDESLKSKLYNILKAYSVYDSEIHYAQGTNFIVLILILNVASQVDAFWLFVQIMTGKNWRLLFLDQTSKLIKILEQFVTRLSLSLPELYRHFEKENFIEQIPGTFAHYFTTIFSYNSPIEFSRRIMDLFWLHEESIIIDTLIEMMKIKEKSLMIKQTDDLHIYLKNNLVKECLSQISINKIIPQQKKKQLVEKEIVIN